MQSKTDDDDVAANDVMVEDDLGLFYDSQAFQGPPSPPLLHEIEEDDGEALPDAEELAPGWTVVSQRFDLIQSPRGSIHSRTSAHTPEEQRLQQANFQAWLEESGHGTAPEDDWSMPTIAPAYRPLPPDTEAADAKEQAGDDQSRATDGRKRRARAIIKCDYVGCQREIEQSPLACPSAKNGEPDYPSVFCSYECMAAWACYEVGDPLADLILKGIDHRAGRKVVPAPSWVDTMIKGMGGLSVAPIDSKGLCLEDAQTEGPESRKHEGLLLDDAATILDEDMLEVMEEDEDDQVPDLIEIEPEVPCRLCNALVARSHATLRVRLHTSAVWAFCSESCAMDHPFAASGGEGFMTLVEWMNLAHKGQCELLRKDTWGTEQDDVDLDLGMDQNEQTKKE